MATPKKGVDSVSVQAVKIASSGEFEHQYCIYNIPADRDIFTKGELSPVSKLIGIPLLIAPFRPSLLRKTYKRKHAPDQYSHKVVDEFCDNTTAGKLMICCDADEARTLPFATPQEWQGKIGTMLVARADREPLYPHHIMAMLGFVAKVDCFDREQLAAEMKANGHNTTEKHVIDRLTSTAFQEYYAELRDSWKADTKNPEEASWLKEPSPFFESAETPAQHPHTPEDDKTASIKGPESASVHEQKSAPTEGELQPSTYQLEAGPTLPGSDPRGTLRLRRGLEALVLGAPKPESMNDEEDVAPGGDMKQKKIAVPPHMRRAMANSWGLEKVVWSAS